MYDPRLNKLANVLVDYSTEVKKGDIVVISFSGTIPIPFVECIYKRCLEKGARYIEYNYMSPEISRIYINNASNEQINYFPAHKLEFLKKVDVYIGISGCENAMHFSNANTQNLIKRDKILRPILEHRVKKTRWVITKFPTPSFAQDGKMSITEFEDFYFKSCLVDYKQIEKKAAKLKKIFANTDKVKIIAKDTNLNFSIKGMNIIDCVGKRNIPDGELFTAPIKDSVEGYLTYNTPSLYMGKEFDGIRLEFKKGKIIKADCSTGDPKALNKIFDTDKGARYIGEFALGLNPKITLPMRDTLFDEKIIGSFHFTPGASYDEAFNGNKSAIHWDLVKLLTPAYGGGEIYFDNKLIMKNGKYQV